MTLTPVKGKDINTKTQLTQTRQNPFTKRVFWLGIFSYSGLKT
ncbi:MAG: hypothetical protein ACJASR_002245 [Psychroserpens sp.]|jgi:hypothetical protein